MNYGTVTKSSNTNINIQLVLHTGTAE